MRQPKIKTIEISAKCSDLFSMYSDTGSEYNGYVPGFFPGEHYGDYVNLVINVETGKIVNWKRPNQETLAKAFQSSRR